MLSLVERIKRAERIQEFWNHDLTKANREKLCDEQEALVNQLFRMSGCETQCTACLAVMDTATTPIKCIICGSPNTVSPYYC